MEGDFFYMRNYSTQMEAARKGIITPELEIVAKKERMTTEELLPLVASGKVAICANKNHKCIDPGKTVTVCQVFLLKDTTNDVTLQGKETLNVSGGQTTSQILKLK